ncbi:protein mono-ADP-ribosyltransferase PARP15-like isoform X1 [Salvelinus sp. IW2-2015]|uniref:protein mono-ADP-ribosyltransferase PARP15-like isoform X1 n=1 Tax=Salvelinus sp. IW2-2015 TaxID=2691554 RepID=UPI000CDFB43B|nr:poly [ADP-ribose] polymerase 15-like isoform X1 [Salvelinus alpinus]
MEFLKSMKTELGQWLSTDPEYIIEKCEDILSVKQGKAVSNQATAAEKICLLLDEIKKKGEGACVEFYEILKKEKAHYPGLQQHFSKNTQVSSRPTVYADCSSTVDSRLVTGNRIKKDLIMHKTIQAGELNPSGMNLSQPPPNANMVAINNSHISAEMITDNDIDGNLDLSWTQAPPPAPVRQASQCPAQQDNLPQHWDTKPATTSVQLYSIQPGSPEYDEVLGLFRATCPCNTIIKIERVQNPNLWKSFQIKKKEIEGRNYGIINERRLFHATSYTTIEHINNNGFNRSYAGQNAALYGNGTYFAVNASYSADDKFSEPDSKGRKLMYLCRVLTGYFITGEQGMKEPPFKDRSEILRYDSTTKDPSDPTEFVVFRDCQAYPEYLITFLGV